MNDLGFPLPVVGFSLLHLLSNYPAMRDRVDDEDSDGGGSEHLGESTAAKPLKS